MSNHRHNGFTLVEALVALTLLTVALVPAFNQASSALALAGSVKNSLIAAHLAQEGVEVVRAMRDANWFANRPFDQGFTACTVGCAVQWNSQVPLAVGQGPLKIDPSTGLYQYATGAATIFSRTVAITKSASQVPEDTVTVTVTWRERTGDKQFAVEEHLYDWLQR